MSYYTAVNLCPENTTFNNWNKWSNRRRRPCYVSYQITEWVNFSFRNFIFQNENFHTCLTLVSIILTTSFHPYIDRPEKFISDDVIFLQSLCESTHISFPYSDTVGVPFLRQKFQYFPFWFNILRFYELP